MSAASLSQAVDKWKQLKLTDVQAELDETATTIATKQDESETSRKKLIELSRQFKQTAAEDVRRVVAPLMRSFQAEVDSLNQRSRHAETAFLGIYQKLAVLPDPLPSLQSAVESQQKIQKQADLEVEVENLRKTLREYNSEFADVKNQEVTVRQLREQIKQYEAQIDTQVQERISAREELIRDSYEQRERELQHAGNILSMKLKDTERRSDALQKALDAASNELNTLRAARDDATDARSDQMDMLSQDLERATAKAESAEREAESLRQQITKMMASSEQGNDTDHTSTEHNPLIEAELRAKDKHISQLLAEVKELGSKLSESELQLSTSQESFEAERSGLSQSLQEAQQRLASQHDYEEIKRELRVLKAIECGQEAGELEAEHKPLEMMLLEKNRQLQNDNAKLRMSERSAQDDVHNDDGVDQVINDDEQVENTDNDDVKSTKSVDKSVREIVTAIECLVGAELVSSYNRTTRSSRRRPASQCNNQNTQVDDRKAISECSPSPTPGSSSSDQPVSSFCASLPTLLRKPTASTSLLNCTASTSEIRTDNSRSERALRSMFNTQTSVDASSEEVLTQELQQRVADKTQALTNAGTPLDTSVVASECKRLLGLYNIGQRLFARALLNQSQGSVSELLSKPRPWERLTEKGRDAFRRINSWLTDERSVELMRTMAKRPSASSNETLVDELTPWKQSQAMATRAMSNGSNTSSHFFNNNNNNNNNNINVINDEQPLCLSNKPVNSLTESANIKSVNNSNIANTDYSASEKLSQFCQQMHVATSNSAAHTSASPSARSTSSQSRWRHDDIPREKIMEIYNRELEKLKEQDSSVEKSPTKSSKSPQKQSSTTTANNNNNNNTTCSTSSYLPSNMQFDMSMLTKNDPKMMDSSRALTALVNQFASVAAASVTQPSEQQLISTLQQQQPVYTTKSGRESSSRSQLPPLTQGQIDSHANLDTDRVVSQVKDFLLMNSISQRQFGECVLGLSQGSVSDLLARPKSWTQLTQKGREPFIRMAIFMKDSVAIERLKTQRQLQSVSNPTPTGSPLKQNNSYSGNDDSSEHGSQHSSDQLNGSLDGYVDDGRELDTCAISGNVRNILLAHGIGQKTFGDVVLAVSQGTVSDILTKPKPWSQLSRKGKDMYVKLQAWLDNPNRLAIFGLGPPVPSSPSPLGKRNAPTSFDLPTMLPMSANSALLSGSAALASLMAHQTSTPPPAKKHNRTTVTDVQKRALRFAFGHDQYPSARSMEFLAGELGLPSRAVTNWFYNQRCRQKSTLTEAQIAVRKLLPRDLDALYPNLRSVYNAQITDKLDDDIPVNVTSLKEALDKKRSMTPKTDLSRQSSVNNQMDINGASNMGNDDDEECRNEVLQFNTPLFGVKSEPVTNGSVKDTSVGSNTSIKDNNEPDESGLLDLIQSYMEDDNNNNNSDQQQQPSSAEKAKGGFSLNKMVDRLKMMAEAKSS